MGSYIIVLNSLCYLNSPCETTLLCNVQFPHCTAMPISQRKSYLFPVSFLQFPFFLISGTDIVTTPMTPLAVSFKIVMPLPVVVIGVILQYLFISSSFVIVYPEFSIPLEMWSFTLHSNTLCRPAAIL